MDVTEDGKIEKVMLKQEFSPFLESFSKVFFGVGKPNELQLVW